MIPPNTTSRATRLLLIDMAYFVALPVAVVLVCYCAVTFRSQIKRGEPVSIKAAFDWNHNHHIELPQK